MTTSAPTHGANGTTSHDGPGRDHAGHQTNGQDHGEAAGPFDDGPERGPGSGAGSIADAVDLWPNGGGYGQPFAPQSFGESGHRAGHAPHAAFAARTAGPARPASVGSVFTSRPAARSPRAPRSPATNATASPRTNGTSARPS